MTAFLLSQVKQQAKELNCPTMVICFEPQPQEYFQPDNAKARLMTLRDKVNYLRKQGVDYILCIRFRKQFAAMTAMEFIENILVDKLAIKAIMIGEDFRFGYKRQGDFALLKQLSAQHHFQVQALQRLTLAGDQRSISSTAVRQAIADNQFKRAQQLLGHPFTIYGRVIHGDKRGRTIGWPTANILLRRLVSPVRGVYIVMVKGLTEQSLQAVCNVGNRPTVGGNRRLLEVHIFNFDKNIYGQYIEVVFLERIRDEMRFDSFEQLTQQISDDANVAKQYFISNTTTEEKA